MSATAATPPQPAPRRRVLAILFLTILMDLIGFGMILPTLPYYARELQISDLGIGLLFSSYSLAQLLFAPLLGRLSDRFGRRPVLLTAIAGNAFAYLLFAEARTFLLLLFARFLSGIAASSYGIAQAYVADVSLPEERSKAMGLVGAAFGLGFVVGPAFGGVLSQYGVQVVPLTAAALSAVNFVFAFIWLGESLSAERRGEAKTAWFNPRALGRLVRTPLLLGLMILLFLVTTCFSMMESTLALYCQDELRWNQRQASYLFAYVGILLVLVQGGLIRRLAPRFGEKALILAGILLMAAGLLLLPASPSLVVLFGALALLAIGSGLHGPSILGLISRLTDEREQGETIGLSRSFNALARAVGPAAGTWLFATVGLRSPLWAAGVLMLAALGLAWILTRRIAVG